MDRGHHRSGPDACRGVVCRARNAERGNAVCGTFYHAYTAARTPLRAALYGFRFNLSRPAAPVVHTLRH